MATTYNYKRVYVWEIPVRVFHWITVIATTILIITGFMIANPLALSIDAEASNLYLMGYLRMTHFVTAYILIANLFFRIYWAFAGNKFANWRYFIPYTRKGLMNIIHVLKVDILLMEDKEHKLHNISIGHNYLAAFSYFIMTLFFILQASTGLALMSETSDFWLTQMFHWMLNAFGGDNNVRYLHHIATWLFLAFILIHVYLVFFHDYVEARGETSAMFSGYKFVRAERIKESEEEFISEVSNQMWNGDNGNKEEEENRTE